MKKENLIGQKFGRLTVVSEGRSFIEGKNKRKKTTWNCVCDCGNTILAKAYHLKNGGVKSCGCYRDEIKIRLRPNQKFGKLTTVSYNRSSVWNCICECGNFTCVKTDKLVTNKTRSCGCLQKLSSSKNIQKAIASRRKYEPRITSARRIWQNYCRFDGFNIKNAILSFDDFYHISQQNCFYCGIGLSNNFNLFKYYKSSTDSLANGTFIYNGLDRINSNLPHLKENCVSCCILCNRAKNNRDLIDFLSWIKKIKLTTPKLKIKEIKFPEKPLSSSIKNIFYGYKKDTDITVEEFYSISQMNCYYCNSKPSNFFTHKNNKKANFYYNGLDRIDSSLNHRLDNIVPCCKHCNFAKNNLSLKQFYEWVNRIQKFQLNKTKRAE